MEERKDLVSNYNSNSDYTDDYCYGDQTSVDTGHDLWEEDKKRAGEACDGYVLRYTNEKCETDADAMRLCQKHFGQTMGNTYLKAAWCDHRLGLNTATCVYCPGTSPVA